MPKHFLQQGITILSAFLLNIVGANDINFPTPYEQTEDANLTDDAKRRKTGKHKRFYDERLGKMK
jgi:hypothetical protein